MIEFPTASVSPCRIRKSVVINFPQIVFQLNRAMLRRMFRKHAFTRGVSYTDSLDVRDITQITERIVRPFGNKDLLPIRKQTVEPVPPIADHGYRTRAGLKQTDTRREPPLLHLHPRDI